MLHSESFIYSAVAIVFRKVLRLMAFCACCSNEFSLTEIASCLLSASIHLDPGWVSELVGALHFLCWKYRHKTVHTNNSLHASAVSTTNHWELCTCVSQLVGTSYQAILLKHVDKENLPEYLGGTSKATLLDDVGPWQDQAIIDEIDAERHAALSRDTEGWNTVVLAVNSGRYPSLPSKKECKLPEAPMKCSKLSRGKSHRAWHRSAWILFEHPWI